MLSRIARATARLRGDERGFAMVPVMAVLMVSGMLTVAAVAAATGDLPIARESQDRKAAYAAAESGLNYYLFQLTQDPDYWTNCDQVPDPNPTDAGDNSPISLAGANPRKWRTVPGTTTKYAIELLPATGKANCVVGDQSTMLDGASGTFRIRVTGRAGNVDRTLIATLRRKGFFDYVYLTDFETLDPDADSSGTTTTLLCARPRSLRSPTCTTIQFPTGDRIKGPMHTNDETIAVCGAPEFGRSAQTVKDDVEVSGSWSPGYFQTSSGCGGGPPKFHTADGKLGINAETIGFPATNKALEAVAVKGGKVYTGKTTINFTSDGKMTVTNKNISPNTQTVNAPNNQVIYVKAGTGCTLNSRPTSAIYDEGDNCAVTYVSGTYKTSMTIASEGDIIVKPNGTNKSGIVRDSNSPSTLGLIANRYVRVYHAMKNNSCGQGNADPAQDVQIDAALLSLQHSFIVDNYSCGSHIGDLIVNGAISQKFRGPVGESDGSGFFKDYNYDDRLAYRNPPYFLPPVNAAWSVARKNEQVPAISTP
jgi:type II secretory pathway pseudopilin PulG